MDGLAPGLGQVSGSPGPLRGHTTGSPGPLSGHTVVLGGGMFAVAFLEGSGP
jgi:hypothetical protein